MGRCKDTYATITDMREISQKTGYLIRNVHAGIGEISGMGYHVDNVPKMQTIELQLITSCGSQTKLSYKSITETNHTK